MTNSISFGPYKKLYENKSKIKWTKLSVAHTDKHTHSAAIVSICEKKKHPYLAVDSMCRFVYVIIYQGLLSLACCHKYRTLSENPIY